MNELTYAECKFIWRGDYTMRQIPKDAGLRWNQLYKQWETTSPVTAQRLAAYADESARAQFMGAQTVLAQSRAVDADAPLPVPDGLAYLPYQRAGIVYAMQRTGALLGDEMGLGKTVEALGVANATEAQTILIVCPASLRINWLREAQKWLCKAHTYHVVDGGKDVPPDAATCVIVNYDVLTRKPIKESLMARMWDVLVVDEAHYIKGGNKVQRAVAVLGKEERGTQKSQGLIHQARRKVFLTGTPIPNRPIELWPLVHGLDPGEWHDFMRFASRYCNAHRVGIGGGRMAWDFDGASHLDELQLRLRASVLVRRRKTDVLTELPAKRRQIIELPPGDAVGAIEAEKAAWARKEAEAMQLRAEMALAHASGDTTGYETAVERLRDAMRVAFEEMSRLRHETALAKAPQVAEHVVALLEGGLEKCLVFAHHIDVIELLRATITQAGYETVVVTGDVSMGKRQEAVDRFQSDKDIRVFIGNIQAAGVGLTLTAASHVVFAELSWVPADITQAEDRAHRIGQTESVLVQHLVFDESLDARMAKTLVAKQAVADAALDHEPILPSVPDDPESQAPRPKAYPEATDAEREAALQGVRLLSQLDPDHAGARNDMGWNGRDGHIGHKLARLERLSNGQVWLARKILRKYRKTQLPTEIGTILWGNE